LARVLIVEDNPASLELMRYLLVAYGHTAVVATDGPMGIAFAEIEKPDLILCDLQIPGFDGFELLRRIRAHPTLGATPVIAVTALAMVGDRERTRSAGFDGYMPKPIEPTTFVREVESYLP
jgi:two-component system cell cycle response regulator